jgi:hypothetical protein
LIHPCRHVVRRLVGVYQYMLDKMIERYEVENRIIMELYPVPFSVMTTAGLPYFCLM